MWLKIVKVAGDLPIASRQTVGAVSAFEDGNAL